MRATTLVLLGSLLIPRDAAADNDEQASRARFLAEEEEQFKERERLRLQKEAAAAEASKDPTIAYHQGQAGGAVVAATPPRVNSPGERHTARLCYQRAVARWARAAIKDERRGPLVNPTAIYNLQRWVRSAEERQQEELAAARAAGVTLGACDTPTVRTMERCCLQPGRLPSCGDEPVCDEGPDPLGPEERRQVLAAKVCYYNGVRDFMRRRTTEERRMSSIGGVVDRGLLWRLQSEARQAEQRSGAARAGAGGKPLPCADPDVTRILACIGASCDDERIRGLASEVVR